MNFLVVGLGSMGKRRVRNLLALEQTAICGFDIREDRRIEASQKYGIRTFESFDIAVAESRPDALIISVPPDRHLEYATYAVKNGIPCFIEASVTDADGLETLSKSVMLNKGLVVAPSCTMRYFPAPAKIKKILGDGRLGKIFSFNYHVGQYLPDWHPWEDIRDFYVSNNATGGCREIVPFELTWINEILGAPEPSACLKTKISDLDADIDDVYHCVIRYPGGAILNLTIDVLARPKAIRRLHIVGSDGLLTYDGEDSNLRWCNVASSTWQEESLLSGTVEKNYIYPEEPYIEEISDFLQAVKNKSPSLFPNSLESDIKVLRTLYRLEELSRGRN